MAEKKISSFKKFTEMSNSLPIQPEDNTGMPLLPSDSTKSEVTQSTRYMRPKAQSENGNDYTIPETDDKDEFEERGHIPYDEKTEEKIQIIGKVAKLPKGVKASKGLNFMENIKIPKSSIWYLMVEKNSNELQTIKYNQTQGFDLGRFTNDLKGYYINKFKNNPKIVEKIKSIEIDGDEKYSWIKNIPLISIDGKKLVSIITEDIIKLLSK